MDDPVLPIALRARGAIVPHNLANMDFCSEIFHLRIESVMVAVVNITEREAVGANG